MAISDAQFAAWLLSDNSARCVLAELDYQFENAGAPATGTLYFSDKVYFDGAGAHPYIDCINSVPQFSRSLSGNQMVVSSSQLGVQSSSNVGGNQLGAYSSSLGTLELDNADGSQDSILGLSIDGSAIRFYLGDVSWARSDFRFIFSALSLKAVAPSFDRISVQLKDTGELLNKSVGGTVKVGGTGPNADQWRPINFGLLHQVQCMALDPTNLIYVHSDTGYGLATSSGSFAETIRDRGVPVVFTDNGDGTFTLAASPAGTITADLLYVAPAAGSQYRAMSDAFGFFIRDRCGLGDLGLYYGPGPTYSVRPDTGIDAWVAAGGEDYFIGISIAGAQNVSTLLGSLADSGLCFWAIRRDSKFTFGRLRPNYTAILGVTAAHTITPDNIDDGSFQIDQMPPLYSKYQATMSKNWSIQTDLATSLSAADRAKFIRPGLYVLQNNGVGADYANAPELYNKTLVQSPTIDTLLSGADDTTDPAVLQLWMETRRAMSLPWITITSVTVGIEFYDVELGDLITVKIPRYGYDAGVDFQVISIDIKLPAKIDLKMIRRNVQVAYGSRTTTPPDGAPFSGPAKMFLATASLVAGLATGTGVGTAPPAPLDAFTVTASFIPGAASSSTMGGPGAVVNIATAAPITGGPITTSGTIGVTDFVASGASHARGTVPDPGSSAGTTKFLREDATFAVPPGSASPLTTKGDVYGHGSVDARIPIGTDGQVLTADSAQTLGVKWATTSAGGGGTLQSQEFDSSGTFTPATGVTGVWVSGSAGGGGGGTRTGALGAGGGGAGEFCEMVAITVSGAVTVTIGAGGAGGASGAAHDGAAGGNTTFGTLLTLLGGRGATGASNAGSGAGGGPRGGVASGGSVGTMGTQESPSYWGGSSGGAGATTTGSNGNAGAPAAGFIVGAAGGTFGSTQGGGGAGGASIRALGGVGGNGGSAGTNAAANTGAGGGGAGGLTGSAAAGGNGGSGWLTVFWVG